MEQNRSIQISSWGLRISGSMAVLIGGYWFVAWMCGWAGQWSVQGATEDHITMKTNMALGLLLAGLTMFLVSLKKTDRATRTASIIFSCVVFLTGFLTLSEYILHLDLGIDQLLAKELPGAGSTTSPNRMGLIGSVSLSLLGSGLLFLLWDKRLLASYLGSVVCIINLIPLFGYFLNVDLFFSQPEFTAIALPTSLVLTVLALGLLFARGHDGIIAMFFSKEPVGVFLRRLLPVIILLPLVMGFLIVNGERSGILNINSGIGVFVVVLILLLLTQAILTARALNRADEKSRIGEKLLKESETKYRELIKYAPAGIYEVDFRSGRFISVNDSMCLLTGYSRDELLSMSPFELLEDEGKKTFQARIGEWLSGEKPDENVEYRIRAKDGQIIYSLLNVKFKTDEKGRPSGATVIGHDITKRKLIEEKLRISEERLRIVFESMREPFAMWDVIYDENNNPVDFQYILVNIAHAKYLNLTPDELIGKRLLEHFPGLSPNHIKAFKKVAETLNPVIDETPAGMTGKVFSAKFWSPRKGMVAVISTDITERRMAELELEKSNENYMELVKNARTIIIKQDTEGRITYMNEYGQDFFGYTEKEIIGKTAKETVVPQKESSGRDLYKMVDNIYKDPDKFSVNINENIKKNGERVVVEWYNKALKDKVGNRTGHLAIGVDITERVRDQDKLNLALEKGNIGIWEWNIKTDEVRWDDRLENMFGLDPGTFGNTFDAFERMVHEEDLAHIRMAIKTALEKDLPFETVFRTRSGNKVKYLSSKAQTIKDNDGKPVGMIGVCFDVSGLKQGTEQVISKLNMELLRSNKELESFAYIASHDLQEPLRMVSSFTQLLKLQYNDKLDDKAMEYIDFAVDGSKRMYDLLNGLLAYSRIHTKGKQFYQVDLNKALELATKNLTLNIREKNAVIKSDELPSVIADENQMIQLFQNLISNGIKFNKQTPEICISSQSNADHHLISVKDNGIGIESQYFDRIFVIFQRLFVRGGEYEGTGIGLSICKRIVERHDGKIWVESEPGKGSVFFFTIPRDMHNS